LRTRIIVGSLLLAALGLACWIDVTLQKAYVSSAIIVVLGLMALHEWAAMFRHKGGVYPSLLYLAGIAYPVLEECRILAGWTGAWIDPVFFSLFVFVLFVRAVLAGDVEHGTSRVANTLLGFLMVYLFYRLIPVLLLDGQGGGLAVAYGLVLTSKCCDIGAYLTGSLIGKRKLIPKISPGKTWAGLVGGLVLSTAVGVCVILMSERGEILFGLVFGFAVAVATVFGDLAESMVKRSVNVKDSAGLLPGAGGILDLIDSLILAAPIGYIILILF